MRESWLMPEDELDLDSGLVSCAPSLKRWPSKAGPDLFGSSGVSFLAAAAAASSLCIPAAIIFTRSSSTASFKGPSGTVTPGSFFTIEDTFVHKIWPKYFSRTKMYCDIFNMLVYFSSGQCGWGCSNLKPSFRTASPSFFDIILQYLIIFSSSLLPFSSSTACCISSSSSVGLADPRVILTYDFDSRSILVARLSSTPGCNPWSGGPIKCSSL
mmetsp:Transcript_37658/g.69478  ORF Transcript_37658/g.69478 Transcript_37658/m.69478 type:complete len:213 (+) Transcript_37658:399-1037(+)